MAQRPEEERLSPKIVPDAEASITAHRQRQPPPPSLWPLWCLIVLLTLTLAGVIYLAWQERTNMHGEIRRLEGQLSNVHARFDVFDDERTDNVDSLDEQFESLQESHQTLRERVEEQEQLIDSVRQASIEGDELAPLRARLETFEDTLTTQESLIKALNESLDALERAGEEGRAALGGRLLGLEKAQERDTERFATLTERLHILREAHEELRNEQRTQQARLDELPEFDPQRLEGIDEALDGLAGSLEALEEQRDTDREELESLRERLSESRSELTELRQGQLALDASLEALQSQ